MTFELPENYTPGPWRWDFAGTAGRWQLCSSDSIVRLEGPPSANPDVGDKALTALAPAMAAEIRRLEDDNAKLREALGLIQDRFGAEVNKIATACMNAEGR